ncbi:ATP-grasp domain-containing protein [Micromonospora sp. WMMD967]|uniref:ATP-grasp domain-containing protein n=1 Tax=Micromonospora sp. WMMD967 TaxID=3016101 RepID=UPI002417856F|nr:ATP-grasp domain-containing protein [Micromonospora sp. WMMD967]MDG4838454.1 ATP-grasp domain-containing protein [Micromonospora sp. WMMD967]
MMLLVPSDPLRPRRPDDHFAPEADAACAAGVNVAVVDHDALTRDDPQRAITAVPAGGVAVYRGWMLRSNQYAAFADALAARGVNLLTGGDDYRRAHELPGWYHQLAPVTPTSTWTTSAERTAFDEARIRLGTGAAVLRDYTKSMKHHWHGATYIPDLTDPTTAWQIAARFLELRADDFTGGFVLRAFEHFTTAEARTWWIGGTCALVGAHPDTPNELPPTNLDLSTLTPLVGALDLPFVTIDLAQRDDDTWRVIELGDAQVSDRPTTISPHDFVAALRTGVQ